MQLLEGGLISAAEAARQGRQDFDCDEGEGNENPLTDK